MYFLCSKKIKHVHSNLLIHKVSHVFTNGRSFPFSSTGPLVGVMTRHWHCWCCCHCTLHICVYFGCSYCLWPSLQCCPILVQFMFHNSSLIVSHRIYQYWCTAFAPQGAVASFIEHTKSANNVHSYRMASSDAMSCMWSYLYIILMMNSCSDIGPF